MNILIVGGGEANKFGNDIAKLARSQGHTVLILSHQDNGLGDPDLYVADFSSLQSIQDALNQMLDKIGHVDRLIYNTNVGGYPHRPANFTSTATINVQRYYDTVFGHCVVPHAIVIQCLKQLAVNSRVVFLASSLAFNYAKPRAINLVGYAGAKAWQTHMMLAFAEYNDCRVTFSSIVSHFDYQDRPKYLAVLQAIFDHLLLQDHSFNGKILDFYNHPTVGVQVKEFN